MFMLSEIYKLYCEERETIEKYEELERKHQSRELGDKFCQYIDKYDACEVEELARIPEVIEDLGENYQEKLDIAARDFGLRDLLISVHMDCIGLLIDLHLLLSDLGHHIKTPVVEEIIANTYMLRSVVAPVDNKLCDCAPSYCRYEKNDFSGLINLEELLKQVSDKTLEEVVQEYCSNW